MLASKLYGSNIISVDNTNSTDNSGEFFQLGDAKTGDYSVTAEDIYKAFHSGLFDDKDNDDHSICYDDADTTKDQCDETLSDYVWAVKKTESYVSDAKASGWQNYSDKKKDSWAKGQKMKKKKLPSSNGGSISEDGTTFATTKIKKVALATSIYKVDEPEPHVTVNLKIGIGTAALKDVSTDNVQWLDYTYADEDVDNSAGKQTFEYKVYTDLAKMVPNAKLGLSSNEDYVLLAGLTTEEWTSGTEKDGKYDTESYSKSSAISNSDAKSSPTMRDVHHVSGLLAYDSPVSRNKAICTTGITDLNETTYTYNSGLTLSDGTLLTAGRISGDITSDSSIAEKNVVLKTAAKMQYISPYKQDTNGNDTNVVNDDIDYFTCRYRWDELNSSGVDLKVAIRNSINRGDCYEKDDNNTYIPSLDNSLYTTYENFGEGFTKDSVVITYYYYARITTTTTSYPTVTTTPYTWDDIPKASASAKPSKNNKTSVNGDDFGLRGKITATADPQVKEEDSNIVGNDTADSGGDGNITLPDGQIISGQYVANLLGLDAWSTSYLTAGSVTNNSCKHRLVVV
jgi:hypothetical protein